jgi:hypothetical protein
MVMMRGQKAGIRKRGPSKRKRRAWRHLLLQVAAGRRTPRSAFFDLKAGVFIEAKTRRRDLSRAPLAANGLPRFVRGRLAIRVDSDRFAKPLRTRSTVSNPRNREFARKPSEPSAGPAGVAAGLGPVRSEGLDRRLQSYFGAIAA